MGIGPAECPGVHFVHFRPGTNSRFPRDVFALGNSPDLAVGGLGMLKRMRKFSFGVAAATALFVFPISAFSQSIEVGPGGVR